MDQENRGELFVMWSWKKVHPCWRARSHHAW